MTTKGKTVRCTLAEWFSRGPAVLASACVDRVEIISGLPPEFMTPGHITYADSGAWRTVYRAADGDSYPLDSHAIPRDIFDLIDLPVLSNGRTQKKGARTAEDVLAAVSDAAIRWAKNANANNT